MRIKMNVEYRYRGMCGINYKGLYKVRGLYKGYICVIRTGYIGEGYKEKYKGCVRVGRM